MGTCPVHADHGHDTSVGGVWRSDAGKWYYEENGVKKTGWLEEKGQWYFMKPDGVMMTGWYQDERNDRYYLNTITDGIEGQMRTGWFLQDGKWYFLNTVHDGFYGRTLTGRWQWIDGCCYLFDDQGSIYLNCVTPDGYTVNGDGQWTVDGVVQYIPGKGIITKQLPGSSGGSGGGSGSSGGSGGGSGSGGSGSGSGSGSGGSGSEGSGGQDTVGKITVQYVVQETGEVLQTKEVTDTVGELYVIQHPSIEGYKILDDQPTEAWFAKEDQTISVGYRAQKAGEEPDESIVVPDELKALVADTAEEEAVMNEIRSGILSYEFIDEDNAELSVENGNPLLGYILEGKFEKDDIIYIDPCEAFPAGLTVIYQGHDDRYNGKYPDIYHPDQHEVIHVKRVNLLDLLGEGTYFKSGLSEDSKLEVAYAWTPELNSETESETENKPRAILLSDSPVTDAEQSQDDEDKFELNVDINIDNGNSKPEVVISGEYNLKIPRATGSNAVKITPQYTMYPSLDMEFDLVGKPNVHLLAEFENEFKVGMEMGTEGDLTELLDQKFSGILNKVGNETQIRLFGVDVQLSGVDMESSRVLGIVGFRILTRDVTFRVDDVFNDGNRALSLDDLNPIIAGMLMLDVAANGSLKADVEVGTKWYQSLGLDIDSQGKVTNLCHFGRSKEELDKNPAISGSLGFSVNLDEAKLGPAAGVGVSLLGIMPAFLKGSFGVKAEGSFGARGDFEVGRDPFVQWDEASTGLHMDAGFYAAIEAFLRLKGSIKVPFGKINPNVDFSKTLWSYEKTLFTTTPLEFEDYFLHITDVSGSIQAVDEQGKNISSEFPGYDPKQKKILIGNIENKFVCPRYLYEKSEDGSEHYYRVTELQINYDSAGNRNYETVDVSRALDLKRLKIHLCQGLKEILVPKECGIEYLRLYDAGKYMGKLDLSKFPKLKELSLQAIYGISHLDISQNPELKTLTMAAVNDITTFTGNGLVMPQGTWYSDPEKRSPVTSCAKGQTIYSSNYSAPEKVLRRRATPSSAIRNGSSGKTDPAGDDKDKATPSEASRSSGTIQAAGRQAGGVDCQGAGSRPNGRQIFFCPPLRIAKIPTFAVPEKQRYGF